MGGGSRFYFDKELVLTATPIILNQSVSVSLLILK